MDSDLVYEPERERDSSTVHGTATDTANDGEVVNDLQIYTATVMTSVADLRRFVSGRRGSVVLDFHRRWRQQVW